DHPGIGNQEVGRVGEGMLQRKVAPEAAARGSHLRKMQVVVRAGDRPSGPHRRVEVRRNLLPELGRFFRVVEVLRAQLVAHLIQAAIREQTRQLIPRLLLEELSELFNQIVGHVCALATVNRWFLTSRLRKIRGWKIGSNAIIHSWLDAERAAMKPAT